MRLIAMTTAALSFLSAAPSQIHAASSYGRQYAFGFRNGNLVRNWSFEALADNWFDESGTTARFLAKRDGIAAISGSYVAKHSSNNTTGSSYRRVTGEFIPVEPGVTYTFSCYIKIVGTPTGARPYLAYFQDRSGTAGSANGTATTPSYLVNASWSFVSFQFTPPAGTEYAQLSLLDLPSGQTGTFYFDDVVIESGVSAAGNRDSISEAVAFLNDAGQAVQTYQKVSGGGSSSRTYLVQADSLDYQLRSVRKYMPFARTSSPDFEPGYAAKAKAYADTAAGRATLGNYPFSSTDYGDYLVRPINSVNMAGDAWNVWDGTKRMRSGSYYTNSLTAPNFPSSEIVNDAELPYLYSWSRDVEGRYSLSWSNAQGQVIQTAVKPASTWLYTRYEYYPDGRLKKVLQNSDVPGDETQQDFRQVTNYNSAGEITSTYSKDRGLRKYWYNRLGQLRFSRHESQPTDEYDYISYDPNDRPFSMGVQTIPGMVTANVEQRDTPSGKTEHKGIIYDNLTSFQSRTGLLLSDILPMITVGTNGEGRVVCEYNLNKSVNLTAYAAKDRFVATFYNYNSYGEVTDAYKYIGPVRDSNKRIHRIIYFYDNNHRLYQTMLQDNGSTPLVTYQRYDYDPLGRIVKVTGAAGKFYAGYSYYGWGGLKSVVLGGTGSSTSGTRMDFSYHAQGWVKEIRATRQATSEVVFQQFLGYEDRAVATNSLPAITPKYDGNISQQLVKFARDLDASNPIRVTNYQYDSLNRMLVADTRKNSGTPPWDANQQIIFNSLSLMDTDDQDSRFTFDDNGRIATNQSGVATAEKATYYYQGNSYKLDHVSGKLNADSPRDASASGTFTYDSRGRMTADASKKLAISYGWDDMPIQFDVDAGDTLISDRQFYDANGNRVCRVRVKTQNMVWVPIFDGETTILVKGYLNPDALAPKVVQSVTDLNLLQAGDRRWVEVYDDAGAIAASSGKSGVFGVSGQIGELNSDGSYRYFVKNHLGSVMRTVGEDGEYLDGAGSVKDYLAYGAQKNLKSGSTEQVQSFTGKELEDATGEYAIGVRWYDPELAIWMNPDPANEFANPYSYVGGNPSNLTDPTGMMSFWDGVLSVLGTVVTNAAGGASCYYSGGNACFFGYYNHEDGESYTFGGGFGAWGAWVGDTRANWRTMEFQTRGGVGFWNGPTGTPIGGVWNFGRTREDGPFFTLDVTMSANFSNSQSSSNTSTVDDNTLQPLSPPEWDLSEDDNVFLNNQKILARKAFLLYYADLAAQGAYWQEEEGNSSIEPGFIDRDGTIIGPFRGAIDDERGVSTLGGNFAHLLRAGDVVVHGHTRDGMKAGGWYNGLSGYWTKNESIGDFGSLVGNRLKGMYAYEPSSKRIFYSNLSLSERFGPAYDTPANLNLGYWDYHTIPRRSVNFPRVTLPLKAK